MEKIVSKQEFYAAIGPQDAVDEIHGLTVKFYLRKGGRKVRLLGRIDREDSPMPANLRNDTYVLYV